MIEDGHENPVNGDRAATRRELGRGSNVTPSADEDPASRSARALERAPSSNLPSAVPVSSHGLFIHAAEEHCASTRCRSRSRRTAESW